MARINIHVKKEQSKIMKFFGILKKSDWEEKEKNIKKLRSSFNKRLQKE